MRGREKKKASESDNRTAQVTLAHTLLEHTGVGTERWSRAMVLELQRERQADGTEEEQTEEQRVRQCSVHCSLRFQAPPLQPHPTHSPLAW